MPRIHAPHTATFLHAIYSPKGGIEGLMAEMDERQVQLTIRHDPRLSEMVAGMDEGGAIAVEVEPLPAGDKGEPSFPLYRLVELSVAEAAAGDESVDEAVSTGTVVCFNHALHGEPNGVVLDNGDFVHLRPEGMRQSRLDIGDEVRAAGPARALQFGGGRVIEALEVNGQPVEARRKVRGPGSRKAPAGAKPGPRGDALA